MAAKKGVKKGTKRTYEHTIKIDGEDIGEYEPRLQKTNHLKQGKIFNDFCILNQEFLRYIMSLKLTVNEHQIVLFLLSYMDMNNKIVIDGEIIEHHLGINKTNVNKYIKRLEKHKIIYKRNLGYRKGQEVLLNFDIISPHMAYKNPNSGENVTNHKRLMSSKDSPYHRQVNAFTNEIDYVTPDGEIFHTAPIVK